MIDGYTKVVLTVIALSLATIAVRGTSVGQATAQPFGGTDCGRSQFSPCYIQFASNPVPKVEIANWPQR